MKLDLKHYPFIDNIHVKETRIVKSKNNIYQLYYKNTRFHWEDTQSKSSLYELYPQIQLAKGDCICTGLGFLLRESFLLQNKNVTSVTVLENNLDVIEIQNQLNPFIMSQLNIIFTDANSYKGSCDTLLLDHWQDYDNHNLLIKIKKCCKNIKHTTLFWWDIIKDYSYQEYNILRNEFKTLPKLTHEQYKEFLDVRL